MSADLFAEFNAPPPSSSSNQQRPPPPPNSQPGLPSAPPAQDPFAFLSSTNQSTFTSPTQQQSSPAWPSFPSQPSWGTPQSSSFVDTARQPQPQPGDAEADDGWGDFEVAQPAAPASQPPLPVAKVSASKPVAAREPPPGRLVRASTLDIINNSLVDTGFSSSRVHEPTKPEPKPKVSKVKPRLKEGPADPSVIFDVADFELQEGEDDSDNGSDDEFGDFEAVESTKPPPQKHQPSPQTTNLAHPPSMDLLSLDDDPPKPASQPPTLSQGPKAASANLGFGATNPVQHQPPKASSNPRPLSSATKKAAAKPAAVAKPVVGDDADEWGAWDDFTSKPQASATPLGNQSQTDSWDWDAVGTSGDATTSKVAPADDQPPPVNVPPPSVLLSAFPALLNSGSDFFKPISGSNTSLKQRVLSDPKATEFLRGYILLATTAAHIIAGRKQRWHRDKILAKSMSLSAAGSKGMKLAGVDKTQSAREDREAADVADAWRNNVGRLRSAVAAANSAGQAPLKVPELSENLTVQTAKHVPTAPKPCVICGLKREERVSKVDHEVEDSFGEWWVDHWGHRACKNFWIQHEVTLRQR